MPNPVKIKHFKIVACTAALVDCICQAPSAALRWRVRSSRWCTEVMTGTGKITVCLAEYHSSYVQEQSLPPQSRILRNQGVKFVFEPQKFHTGLGFGRGFCSVIALTSVCGKTFWSVGRTAEWQNRSCWTYSGPAEPLQFF